MSARPRHRGPAGRRFLWWLPLLLASLITVSSGSAHSYWRGSGDGVTTGTTGTRLPLAISPGTPSTMLRPGGAADVALTISNPNPVAGHLVSLALDPGLGALGLSVDAAHSSCDTSALTFVPQTAGWTVPARSGSADGTLAVVLTGSISMTAGAANACQGALFRVHLRGVG